MVAFYRAFCYHENTYVVLELCPNGSLADLLRKRKYLTLPEIRRYMIQICGAVKYLHHRHIVHRDLKTGNLFLDDKMNVRVGDFGLAALLVTEKEMEVKRRTTMCGTPNYLAPEILEKGKGHNEKVDLWAIGVIAYTLAVGKAPFHAGTKEEIYKKLRCGSYTWPELSATTNQSADLRNLVSSLLVGEHQRPIPDEIVGQNFFRIAYVPSSIPVSARERPPTWPEPSLPSPDMVKRGYSDTWFAICKESGVGQLPDGTRFSPNGGKRLKSIVHDMALEAQMGSQPTMPIPKNVVYLSTVTDWDTPRSSMQDSSEEDGLVPRRAGLKEVAHNEVVNPRTVQLGQNTAKPAGLMAPPPKPSRPGTVKKASTAASEAAPKTSAARRVKDETPAIPMVKTRPGRTTTAAPPNEGNTNATSGTQKRQTEQVVEDVREKSARTGQATKRSADASLARRPRATRTKEKDHPPQSNVQGPLATLDELKQASPLKKTRKQQALAEVIEILSDPERPARDVVHDPILSLPPPPTMSRKLPLSHKTWSSNANSVTDTDPTTVLERLSTLRDNLQAAVSNTCRARDARVDVDVNSLPFVSRWVDYSRKHGVGYVLADGTVGCIINASAKARTPVTHVLVRNGQKWLGRVGKSFEHIECVPLEVLEDCGEDGIARKIYKGPGSVKEGPLAVEAERKKTLSILWVKFGRYMCQSLDGEEWASPRPASEPFVRFYQRIGSVGIWAFTDGCLQVHFPDHTKLVLSAAGTHVSATCISPEAAAYLAVHADLLPHHVTDREVYADRVTALLHDGGRVRARTMRANAVAEKLGFVHEVVGQWVRNGGLGRLDEDDDAGAGQRLHWEGLMVRDGAKKADRVTVGRSGGDIAPSSAAPART